MLEIFFSARVRVWNTPRKIAPMPCMDFDYTIHDFTHALTDWEKGGRLRLAGRGKGARGGRSERLELGQQ